MQRSCIVFLWCRLACSTIASPLAQRSSVLSTYDRSSTSLRLQTFFCSSAVPPICWSCIATYGTPFGIPALFALVLLNVLGFGAVLHFSEFLTRALATTVLAWLLVKVGGGFIAGKISAMAEAREEG